MGFIYTMNAPQGYYDDTLKPYLTNVENLFKMGLHGDVVSYASCDTLQVDDYSRFDMGYFNEDAKKMHREVQFPFDLKECYKMGANLGGKGNITAQSEDRLF